MGLFGFGTSENNSKTNVYNEQVATQSGIATGGNNNTSYITSSDPEVATTAIRGGAAIVDRAFSYGTDIFNTSTKANVAATSAIQNVGSLAILSNADLTKKFADSITDSQAKNIDLLQGIAQNENEQGQRSQELAKGALDASFAVATRANPQSSGYVIENVIGSASKLFLYVIGAVVLIFGFYAFKRRSS